MELYDQEIENQLENYLQNYPDLVEVTLHRIQRLDTESSAFSKHKDESRTRYYNALVRQPFRVRPSANGFKLKICRRKWALAYLQTDLSKITRVLWQATKKGGKKSHEYPKQWTISCIATWMLNNKAADPWKPDLSQTAPPSEEEMKIINQVFKNFPSTVDDPDAPSFPCACPTCREFNVAEFSILRSENAAILRGQIEDDKTREFLRIIELEIQKVEEFEAFLQSNGDLTPEDAVEVLTRDKFRKIKDTFVDGVQFTKQRLSKCYIEGDRNLELSADCLVGKWIRLDLPDQMFSTFSKLCPMKVLALFRTIACLPTMWKKFESDSIQKFYTFDADKVDHEVMSILLHPAQQATMEQFICNDSARLRSLKSSDPSNDESSHVMNPSSQTSDFTSQFPQPTLLLGQREVAANVLVPNTADNQISANNAPPTGNNCHSYFYMDAAQIFTTTEDGMATPQTSSTARQLLQPVPPPQYEEDLTNIVGNQLVLRDGQVVEWRILDNENEDMMMDTTEPIAENNNQEITSSMADLTCAVGQDLRHTSPIIQQVEGPSTSSSSSRKNKSPKLAEFVTAQILPFAEESRKEVKIGKISVPMETWKKAIDAFDRNQYLNGDRSDAMKGPGYVLYDNILNDNDKLKCTLTTSEPFYKLEVEKANAIFDGISYVRSHVLSQKPVKLDISEIKMLHKDVFSEHGKQERAKLEKPQPDNPWVQFIRRYREIKKLRKTDPKITDTLPAFPRPPQFDPTQQCSNVGAKNI